MSSYLARAVVGKHSCAPDNCKETPLREVGTAEIPTTACASVTVNGTRGGWDTQTKLNSGAVSVGTDIGNDAWDRVCTVGDSPLLLTGEDAAFFFAAMTWDADMLEVLLSKAPNPLHENCKRLFASEAAVHGAAFPLPEEVLRVSGEAATPCRPGRFRINKRRKRQRVRGVQLDVPYVPFYEEDEFVVPGEEDLNDSGLRTLDEEERKEDKGGAGQAPLHYLGTDETHPTAETDAIGTNVGPHMKERDEKPRGSMRDFIRIFYLSFLVTVFAQVRLQQHQQQPGHVKPLHLLSSFEYRAYRVVHRYMDSFKSILRRFVMCGAAEVERRGAQPLFVGLFAHSTMAELKRQGDEWLPLHTQLFISGKDPMYQPLLLELLGVSRVVQCYAEPQSSVGAKRGDDRQARTLCRWRSLLLDKCEECPFDGEADVDLEAFRMLYLTTEERATADTHLSPFLSPLVWEPSTPFGPYAVFCTKLPYSNHVISKVVIPAIDNESYDLSKHFQEGIFQYMHGAPLPCCDTVVNKENNGRGSHNSCLLHCSAGMHRSSGLAVAYFLWLVSLSGGKLPPIETNNVGTKTDGTGKRTTGETTLSYVSVVRRSRRLQSDAKDDQAQGSATTAVKDEVPVTTTDNHTTLGAEKSSILHRCCHHVKQQRSMALPIPAVIEQLTRYCHYLRLS
ncbi:hypothetical protein ERJ75_001342100 [Trypanosoma vivax]|uniref:Tyrosine specific protein phosphatases domain-containing protein n=1 Tax=Trypanosoma vivax (strain Y486) TaxID=1055687 RepID=G0U5Z3_TRYVY|nr:hypothetical protein TRVL_04702 [Trypanosoma vivax]KAH8607805.1 hypothetical protein ERJ75_001342100 [Trypanosoma vivax]CCC51294.1 conserved hypothetical protein [Trypanosoma vivax Y486]